jgi:type I restriction enzyme M protein
MGTQGENGQFRTPRHIIDWIVACLDPQPTDKILDPACGTGGFLVSAYRHILQKHTSPGSKLPGDRLGHEQRQRLYANFTGYDITDLMVKLSKVNLFLHQFPSPAIHIYDSLSNDARWSEKADLILANPPFMTPKGGVTPHTKFRVPAKKAEVLFTDYIAEHLTPDGRAGIIVPNGIVATTQNAYVSLRRFLVEDSLVAVVSLPAGVFKPYSGVKTSILLLDKKLARRTDKILFLKIAADGFDLGDQRREITANDLPEAERVMKAWFKGKLGDDFASSLAWKLVEKHELLAHRGCNLDVGEIGVGKASSNGEMSFFKVSDLLQDVRLSNKVQKNQFLSAGRYPIVAQSENFIAGYWNDDADVFRVKTPLVLFGDHTRRFKYVDFDFVLGADGVKVLRFDERVLPRYAYFALSALKLRDLGYSRHYKELLSHEIPLPPLEEQRRIVAEIEGYQQVIDGARQILAAYRPSFVIDPEWSVVELREVVTFSSGGTPPKSEPAYWTGSIPWVSARDMKVPKLADSALHVSASAVAETATQLAPVGSILILVRGMGLANGVPICELLAPCAFNQDIKALQPKPNVDSAFLAAALRQEVEQFKNALGTAAHGTLKIESEQLQKIRIPLPPLPEQRRIVAELDAEAAEVAAVRALIPRTEAKIQRVLARVWGTGAAS